jgi:hypothetical protein
MFLSKRDLSACAHHLEADLESRLTLAHAFPLPFANS